MKYIIAKQPAKAKNKPLKIFPIKKAEFEEVLKDQSDYVKNFINTSRSGKDVGDFFLIRNHDGILAEVIFITDNEPNIYTYACLAKKLPEGEYVIDGELSKKEATDIAIGWELGTYSFSKYKEPKNSFAKLIAPKNADIAEAENMITSIYLARDLINTAPADMGPKELAEAATQIAHEYKASYIVYTDNDLLENGYESIYTVGKGSAKRPKLVDIRWGNSKSPKVTLVGKGVTFDTGGLNIKNESGMLLMKKDMAGAAIALSLGRMIMQSELDVNLRILLPMAENAISGESMLPSDVIRTRAGITVEITNTDAEGRLVLCEPLAEADSENPELLIDFATLTGAARTALGTEVGAYFTKSDELAKEIEQCAKDVADPIWRLPLWDAYKTMLKSKVADLVNSPDSGNGGAITAALFLKEFVKNTKNWLHFDIAAWNMRERAGKPIGGEPMAMRAVYEMLKKRYG